MSTPNEDDVGCPSQRTRAPGSIKVWDQTQIREMLERVVCQMFCTGLSVGLAHLIEKWSTSDGLRRFIGRLRICSSRSLLWGASTAS